MKNHDWNTLNLVKEFALNQMDEPVVWVDDRDGVVAVSNPWMDASARFPLTDEQARAEWGGEVVEAFIAAAVKHLGI